MSCIFVFIHIVGSENIKMFILDEADELLCRGSNDQISDLFTMLPASVQVIVTSDTMAFDLLEITTKYMHDPVKVLIKREERTLEGIRQFYVNVEREVSIFTCHSIIADRCKVHLMQKSSKICFFVFNSSFDRADDGDYEYLVFIFSK